MNDKPKRGGKREGAGRKPQGDQNKVAYQNKLPVEVVAFLRSRDNAAGWLADAIKRTKDFREWQK